MARIARKNLETNFIHVMVQGIGKEYIFPDDESKGYYLTSIQKAQTKIKGKIIAFCVMDNHAHLLIIMEKMEELGKFMQLINSEYAKYYNRIKNRVGYVFRDRFKSEGITDIKYLINCAVYIQKNPIKAGIVEKAEDYKYSSYTNYLCGKGLVNFEEAAKYFEASPKGMQILMEEISENNWMEHNDKDYEDKNNVLHELTKRYNIHTKKLDENLIIKMAKEIHERCGTSYREISNLLDIGRETLRKLLSTPPSP